LVVNAEIGLTRIRIEAVSPPIQTWMAVLVTSFHNDKQVTGRMMRTVEMRQHLTNLLDWPRETATRRYPLIDATRCKHTNERISHTTAKGVHKVTRNNIWSY
jgi:hypothetical protein